MIIFVNVPFAPENRLFLEEANDSSVKVPSGHGPPSVGHVRQRRTGRWVIEYHIVENFVP